MPANGILTQKEKELVAVGASIAAGCQPCTAHHFRAARAAGATDIEIRQAVDDALCVRQSAAKVMAELAEKHLGGAPESDGPCCSEKPRIGELVSAGAAFALNCVTDLEIHVAAARRKGATERQIETALGIARMVKKVAGQKVEAAAEAITADVVAASAGCADDCGCHAEGGQPSPAARAGDASVGAGASPPQAKAAESIAVMTIRRGEAVGR